MNGHTLETLREMSQKEKIPPSIGLPVMFGAMADMVDSIKQLGSNQEQSKGERAQMSSEIGKLSDDVNKLSAKIDNVNDCMKTFEGKIDKNPAIKVGIFIQNYKNLSIFLGVIALLFLTAWSIPGVRIGFFEWIGMPDSWIVFLNP